MNQNLVLEKEKVKSNYSGADQYDLVIIGSGLSGLSAGMIWQKNTQNKRTLIIEKNSYPGGYSTAYEREGYIFETTQLFPDIVDILGYLGIELNLKQYEGNFMRRLVVDGDRVDEYKIPAGAENFKEYLVKIFPEDARKIRSLMDYSVDMFKQVRKLKANSTLKDKLMIPFQAPKVVANLNRTYSGLLDTFGITNPKLREVMETFTSFSGVPSGRASAIMATGAMLSSMTRCFRPYGYVEKLKNTIMSVSSINVVLGLDDRIDMNSLDLDYPCNVVSTGLGTADKLFEGYLAGDQGFSDDCFHMAVICPSITTGAKNTVTLRCTPFALNQWKEWRERDYQKYKQEKDRWGDFFISIAEKYFIPNLSKHIVVKDISTPATYSRYSGSPSGSLYDMASLVTQFGPRRLPMKTPVKNLYQPRFSHGLYGTMMNGVQVVDLLLDRKFNNGNSLFAPVSH